MSKSARMVDISNEEYHASEGLSSSAINLILDCPRKYYYKYILKRDFEQTDAMAFGSMFHAYILEREKFKEQYFIVRDMPRAGSKGRLELEKKAFPKEIIKLDDFYELFHMKQSLHELPNFKRMLSNGEAEKSIYWQEPETGVILKCRPDFFNTKVACVFDLKTTKSASVTEFSKSIYNYGYYIQAALQIDGLKAVFGVDYSSVNIAIEKVPPYLVGAYRMEESAIEMGRFQYKRACRRFLECKQNNKWPGYSEKIEPIALPYWVEGQLNNQGVGYE